MVPALFSAPAKAAAAPAAPRPAPPTITTPRLALSPATTEPSNPNRLHLDILLLDAASNPTKCGSIALSLSHKNSVALHGPSIHPGYTGRGFATESIKATLSAVFGLSKSQAKPFWPCDVGAITCVAPSCQESSDDQADSPSTPAESALARLGFQWQAASSPGASVWSIRKEDFVSLWHCEEDSGYDEDDEEETLQPSSSDDSDYDADSE